MKLPSVIGREPNAAQCTVIPRFNQLSNDCEYLSQRRSRKNQPQNVKHCFRGKQT
jgi:hypothetical protein